ncbi:MAG TPA: hypothetical protein VGU02_05790, partial [Gaiellaceae bacterium]|nr:hypothetical protein [Gaiellaceae bacterium]
MSLPRAHDQTGQALPIVLLAMIVLSAITAALLTGSALNHRSALTSSNAKQAFALAQEGLADAEGVLYTAVHSSCTTGCVPAASGVEATGTFTYSGSPNGNTWTLTSTGTANGVSRTVSTQITVTTTSNTTYDDTMWSYIYVKDSNGVCTTVLGGSHVNVPMYTPGNLCFSGSGTFTGSDLEVGGYLNAQDSGGNVIGTSTSKIAKLVVGGTCTQMKSGKNWPCTGAGPTIWAASATVGTAPASLPFPADNLTSVYATEKSSWSTQSGCPAGLIDTDIANTGTTLNASAGTVNPFPTNTSYDCKIGSNELKWNAAGSFTKGTLLIKGTFVLDGNVSLGGGMAVTYTGGGVLYFTGSVVIAGGSSICGGTSGTGNCTGWNPGGYDPAKSTQCSGCNELILVASCWKSGTTSFSGPFVTDPCVDVTGGTTLQAGVYSYKSFKLEGGSVQNGP